jgi:predicted ATP-dependent endonuclease of OLD family
MKLKAKNVENKEAKYIDKVEIKGLFGRYDVDWKLNPDVNILVGENGTGKSTILKAIMQAKEKCGEKLTSNNELNYRVENWIDNLRITFESKPITPFSTKDNNIEKDYNNIIIPKFYYVDTFDTPLQVTDIEKRFKKNLYSDLDFMLDEEITAFVSYQLDQTKKIINQKIETELAYAKIRFFIKTLNQLFENTKKVFDENDNRIVFVLDDFIKIEPNQLSSGEKQLLLILLTVLNQDEKPSILLMDEPEISLHFTWQYELIKIIRELNPNCQLIIVTHSASIFAKGWMDKLFFIESENGEGIRHKITQTV